MTRARDNANNWAADITGVTAGTGITGGGTSGTVTVTNEMATTIDAKGDLVVGSGADAFVRVPVGTNNQVLTADSATTSGVKWATADALPSQTSKTNKFLSTNGTTASWQSIDGGVSDWVWYAGPANPTSNAYQQQNFIKKVNGYWFILTGNGFIFYSSDAKSWTRWASTATEGIYSLNGMAFGNGTYIFFGDSGLLYSATSLGGTLTSRTTQFSTNSIYDAVYMAGSVNLFIIVGSGGSVSTSPDGITWTARTANQSTATIYNVAVNADSSLALLASNGSVANNASYSTNGTTWTAFSPDGGSTSNRQGIFVYDNGNSKWIYVGSAIQWWESTNPTGGTWTDTVRVPVNYSMGNSNYVDRTALYGGTYLSKDETNNKYIVISPHGNGWLGIYTFDATTSVTLHSGKTYRLENVRQVYVPSGLGTNGYQGIPSIGMSYDSGTFVATGNQVYAILSNA
jgi:hypothetical protein